jgi:hypothetical protein
MNNLLKIVAANVFFSVLVGCASPQLDVAREWTLLDQPRAKVEAALTQAGYLEVEKKMWGRRAESGGIDRYMLWPDSTGNVIAVNRMRIIFDTTRARQLFEQELQMRITELGEPTKDESVDDPMDEERSITWQTDDAGEATDVALRLRGKQGLSTGSALSGGIEQVRDKLLGKP